MCFVLKIKKTAILLSAAVLSCSVLVFSSVFRQGVLNGLRLCADSVIPSLFLFTAAALFLIKSGVADTVGQFISYVTKPILSLTGKETTVFLISCVAGYPVGAKLIGSMYNGGNITRQKALKMLNFSVNAGPAFILIVLGDRVLNSQSDGTRLLIVHLLATFIMALTARFLPDRLFGKANDCTPAYKPQNINRQSTSDLFVLSVMEAGKTMLTVCVFVVFFSSVGYAVSCLPLAFSNDLGSFLEVTAGLNNCTRKALPKAAFLLGFGGLSVIFQVKSAAEDIKPPIALIFLSRIFHGTLSAVLCVIAEWLSPRDISVGSFNVQAENAALTASPLAVASIIFMCVVLLGFCEKTLKRHRNSI